jgi:hypothetical protein
MQAPVASGFLILPKPVFRRGIELLQQQVRAFAREDPLFS